MLWSYKELYTLGYIKKHKNTAADREFWGLPQHRIMDLRLLLVNGGGIVISAWTDIAFFRAEFLDFPYFLLNFQISIKFRTRILIQDIFGNFSWKKEAKEDGT